MRYLRPCWHQRNWRRFSLETRRHLRLERLRFTLHSIWIWIKHKCVLIPSMPFDDILEIWIEIALVHHPPSTSLWGYLFQQFHKLFSCLWCCKLQPSYENSDPSTARINRFRVIKSTKHTRRFLLLQSCQSTSIAVEARPVLVLVWFGWISLRGWPVGTSHEFRLHLNIGHVLIIDDSITLDKYREIKGNVGRFASG